MVFWGVRRKNSDLELTAVKESSLVKVKVTKVIFIYKLTEKIRKKTSANVVIKRSTFFVKVSYYT